MAWLGQRQMLCPGKMHDSKLHDAKEQAAVHCMCAEHQLLQEQKGTRSLHKLQAQILENIGHQDF